MARKKIVFVIVEGPSDDEALGLLLSKIYDKARVFVHITHGDITTQAKSDNILLHIGGLIMDYAKSNHFTAKNFQEIIHIVDMDGAYIPDEAIKEDLSAERAVYSLTTIYTNNVVGIQHRNGVKSKCLKKMSSARTIWGIPYQVYYMSCNLEHVLYDKINSTDKEKEKMSLGFARKYKEDIAGFIEFISNSSFSVAGDYLKTWEYIRIGLHSLERHTNLGICLSKAIMMNIGKFEVDPREKCLKGVGSKTAKTVSR